MQRRLHEDEFETKCSFDGFYFGPRSNLDESKLRQNFCGYIKLMKFIGILKWMKKSPILDISRDDAFCVIYRVFDLQVGNPRQNLNNFTLKW